MKQSLLKLCCLGGLIGLLTLSTLAGGEARAAAAASLQEQEKHSALEEAMEAIEDNMRSLRKSLREEGQNADSLKSIVALQAAAARAKLEEPPMTATLEAEKRGDFVIAYRREMISMGRKLLDLEDLVLQNKLEEAMELYKEIHRFEDSGHERFTEGG